MISSKISPNSTVETLSLIFDVQLYCEEETTSGLFSRSLFIPELRLLRSGAWVQLLNLR